MAFERITEITGAFDRRHTDPKQNFGIGGMVARFVLKGPLGAVQFVVSLGIYLPHCPSDSKVSGWDLGYHSPKPMYEGQNSMGKPCEYLGVDCYYDGSSLMADEWVPGFIENGSDWVWQRLEGVYRSRFEMVSP